MPVHPLAQDLDFVFDETKEIWEPLRERSLFLTGGTGFVGTWLVETFLWANRKLKLNATVTLLSRNPDAFRLRAPEAAADPSLQLLRGSIQDFAFPPGDFPFIIHAATDQMAEPTTDEPGGTFDRELRGTRRVLEFARHKGAKRLLFTSSGAVYGRQPADVTHLSEDFLGAPATTDLRSAYGQAKRASEFLCTIQGNQFGFEPIIARLFAFVGPLLRLDLNFAIGNFVRDALRGGPIRIGGDGTPLRSYLYAADLAIWLWKLFLQGQPARPYNVGSDVAVTIRELAEAVAANSVNEVEIEIAQKPSPDKPPLRYVPAIDRARQELGLQVNVALDEAIRRMVAWHTRPADDSR